MRWCQRPRTSDFPEPPHRRPGHVYRADEVERAGEARVEIVVAGPEAPPLGPAPERPEPAVLASGEYVFVPVHEPPVGAQVLVELRTLVDGRVALPVYGSATMVVRCCGDGQPYGVFEAAAVEDLFTATGADVVGIDLPLPPEERR